MVAHKSSRDVLSQLHEQHAQDKKNDRMETGSFPVVRKKPKRPVKDGSARMRLMTSVLILIMCALLGYGYMIQINNADATYETLSEDELTRLISETGTQVQNLEQRKSELTNQLESLKAAANKTQEAERIAKQNEETNGILARSFARDGQGRVDQHLPRVEDEDRRGDDVQTHRGTAQRRRRGDGHQQRACRDENLCQRHGRRTGMRRCRAARAVSDPGHRRSPEPSERRQYRGWRGFESEGEVRRDGERDVLGFDYHQPNSQVNRQYVCKGCRIAFMTDPIPSAGETTIIGLPAIQIPITTTGDRPLTQEDIETIARLAPGTALLISTRGAVSGSRYLLDEDEVTVGRDSRADILLDDSTVSRSHAVFRRVGDTFVVYDSGSLNGTYVNRQRVDHQQLRNGDEIMIGKFRLVFFTKSAVIA